MHAYVRVFPIQILSVDVCTCHVPLRTIKYLPISTGCFQSDVTSIFISTATRLTVDCLICPCKACNNLAFEHGKQNPKRKRKREEEFRSSDGDVPQGELG
jgi:hypothetical protein